MQRLLWLEGWEWECCGAPFRVGETVEWSRRDVEDRAYLTNLLGTELGAAVTDDETHHFGNDEEPQVTPLVGQITRIRAVFATRAPRQGADARVLVVVAGSATFAERETGDAAEYSAARERGQTFEGYLVDLAL